MQIRFVQENDGHGELSETLRVAYAVLQETNLNPEWISAEDCLKIKERNSDVFVCDPFTGPVLEHLKRLKCRILGPQCVVHCVERREALPKLPYPVYMATMKGVVVSCTSIEKKIRLELHEKIQLMGGEVSGNLTSSVTHLVAGEVGSKKYHVACNLQKPVMLPDWVFHCWKIGLTKNICAKDTFFDDFKCPIFKGLHITVSQVDSEERKKIQKIVSTNGGKYTGEMRANDTTHLIAIQPEGQKYHFACQWKIHCVTVAWLFDSLKKGFCMDESLYKLSTNSNMNAKTSTPVASPRNDLRSLPNTSSISNASMHSRINETVRSDVFNLNKSAVEDASITSADPLENLSLSAVSKAGNFLDGCKIYFSGFSEVHLEKLRKIVNMGGGTRFSQLCDSVSHVVVSTGTKEDVQALESLQGRPYVVSVDWLIESCKIGRQADETPFLTSRSYEIEDPAKVNGSLQLSPKVSKSSNPLSKSANTVTLYDDEVMCQYLQRSSLTLNDEALLQAAGELLAKPQPAVTLGSELQTEHFEADPNATNEENIDNDGLFKDLVFAILGFDNEDASLLEDMIIENKGSVLPLASSPKPSDSIDYCVVPLLGSDEPVVVGDVVTNYWVQMCIEKSELLSLVDNEIFRPLCINIDAKPLSGCVLSISQYSGTERDALVCIAEILGANYQEFFVRKANTNSNLIPSTHLVCMTADGSKYKGAVNWGLPAVTKNWLLVCGNSGSFVSEDKYLVGATRKPNHLDVETSGYEIQKTGAEHPHSSPISIEDKLTNVTELRNVLQSGTDEQVNYNICTPVSKRVFTPARTQKPQVFRIKELIREDRVSRPVSPESAGVDTPGKFLDPGVPFKPSFDFTEVVKMLDSPSQNNISRRRSSVSVEDWLGVHLQQAVTQTQQKNLNPGLAITKVSSITERGPLSAVTICVSKKLSSEQGELNDIVLSLGGAYRWTYDTCCTHFVFRGKSSDASKELKLAREQGKKIVSPDWLYTCKENQTYEDEELYPFTYNSNMTLEVKPTKVNSRSKTKQPATNSPSSNAKDVAGDESDESTVEHNGSLNSSSSSKDNQTSVNRQMELMLATKTGKGSRKRKQSNSVFVQPTENNRSSSAVRNESPSHVKEVSSSVPITWDDPTSRLEREKLAEQLAKESQPLSPVAQHVATENQKNEQNRTSNGSNKENSDSPPPPTFLCPNASALKSKFAKNTHRLMLSGMSNQERIDYAELVEELGGSVSDGQHFDNNCTHLVVSQPSRNEKYLASVAAGKWILHKSYLEACRQEHRFVEEMPYEWGSETMLKKMPLANSQLLKIAQSANRWRLKLNNSQNKLCLDTVKAFNGWNAIIYTDKQRESSFRRLLEAGGATVIPAQFPFSNPKGASVAFLELSKAPSQEVDLQALLDNGVECVKPEYIAAFLTDEPSPPIENFYIQEIRHLLSNDEQDSTYAGKRKSGSSLAQRTKKTRR